MVGEGGKDWGSTSWHEAMDDIGVVLKSWKTWVSSTTLLSCSPPTTAQRRSPILWRRDAIQGAERRSLEGGYRAPAVIRWSASPSHTVLFPPRLAAHFVEAGGPKGDGLKKELEQGSYPGIVKTTLDGVNQIDYLTGKSDKSARNVFYYFSGATPSAVRYNNWKMYYNMSQPGADGWILPLIPFHFTLVDNIKRDPFEQAVGIAQKSAMSMGGALAGPVTAFQYDWNLLPLGQQLWLDWFETLKEFPPMQKPESYNLTQVMDQMKASGHPSD
jgi:arylsulfatase